MTLTVQAMAVVIVVAQAMARNGEDDLCPQGREGSEEDDLCQRGREGQLSRRG